MEMSLEDLILYFLYVVLLKCVSLKSLLIFLKLALYTNVFIHFHKAGGDRPFCLLGFCVFHNLTEVVQVRVCKAREQSRTCKI